MKFSVRTSLVIASAGVYCLSAGGIFAANDTNLTTNLATAVQHIERVVFATPDGNGGWKSNGQVKMYADNGKLRVEGSLVTNKNQTNKDLNPLSTYSSILGGKSNEMIEEVKESTILGGEGNKNNTHFSLIAGGKSNIINKGSERSVILGGSGNIVSLGTDSLIVGGQSNTVKGNSSSIIGTNSTAEGNYSVAAGKKTVVTADSTFAWNDGTSTFTVNKPNFFATQSANGVVVGSPTPHAAAKLTINGTNGDLRIQINAAKDATTCNSTTLGVIKSVANSVSGKACPCFCDGTSWRTMIDSPSCTNACKDPSSQLTPKCGTTYKTCSAGTPLEFTTDTFASNISTQHWTCATLENGKMVSCKANFTCTGSVPANSQLCDANKDPSKEADNRNLFKDTPITPTGVCHRYTKCEYICKDGYKLSDDGKSCVVNSTPSNKVNGVCGSAHGTTVSTKPTTNLCTTGGTPTVNGTGPWTWTCSGSNGGSNASCSANLTVSCSGKYGNLVGTMRDGGYVVKVSENGDKCDLTVVNLATNLSGPYNYDACKSWDSSATLLNEGWAEHRGWFLQYAGYAKLSSTIKCSRSGSIADLTGGYLGRIYYCATWNGSMQCASADTWVTRACGSGISGYNWAQETKAACQKTVSLSK